MAFDLSSLAEKTEAVGMVIKHPTTGEDLVDEKGNKVMCFVYGMASKRVQDFLTKAVNSELKKTAAKTAGSEEEVTYQKYQENKIKDLLIHVDRFENLVYKDVNLETEEGLQALFSNPSFYWLKDQIIAFAGKQSNFF